MMAEELSDKANRIIVHGNGAYYAERAADASRYTATRDVRIGRAELVCPADHLLDVDDLIIQHAAPVQELARRYLGYLQIEMLPGSIGEPVDEALIADIIETASGWHLLRAIDGACHGYPVGERGTEIDDSFLPRVTASRDVQQVLSSTGVRAIRFMDVADGQSGDELGPFYFILDRTVLRRARPDAHFSLRFADHATAEQAEAAQALCREWPRLDETGRDVVRSVVGLCRRSGEHTTLPFREGGAYAYPHPGGGIAWGLEGRYGVIARGVQRLPADARPEIQDLGDLRTIAESWRQLGDAAAQDPARAKDLLAAAGWHQAAASAWLQSARLEDAELIEAQAHLDAIGARLDAVRSSVETYCTDPAWVTGFDAAGWPDAPHQSVALTLSAFMLQLYEGAAAPGERDAERQQSGPEQQGRGR
jgi:hypothetical protein